MNKKMKIIFIAGTSYSGSTILGLALGSLENVFYGGELDKYGEVKNNFLKSDHKKEIINKCTCGQEFVQCPFWSKVFSLYHKEIDFNPQPGFSWQNIKLGLKILFFKKSSFSSSLSKEYLKYLKVIYQQAGVNQQKHFFLIDSSKSLHTLFYYLSSPEIDLSVIHIIKRGVLTASSFKKHGRSPFYGVLAWVLTNFFIILLAKKKKIKYKKITYQKLSQSPTETMQEISFWLKEKWPKFCQKQISYQSYHLLGGNPFLNKIKQGDAVKEIKFYSRINNLTKIESKLIHFLTKPFDFFFGVYEK